jgi:hypothetical protein
MALPHVASTMGRKTTYPRVASSRLVDISSRLLNAEDDGTLRYFVHDATYRRNKKLPLETPMLDPDRHYSVTNTVNFFRQADLETQAHGATVCSALIAEYNRLQKGHNSDGMAKDYIATVRSGDKILQPGAISPPHTIITDALCNTPHLQ